MSEKQNGCVLCEKGQHPHLTDQENLVLYRGTYAFALMNIYPYNNGHLMIAPYTHASNLTQLSQEEINDLFQLTQRCESVLARAFHPEGFNIGINVGKVAGAGIADHLHVHVVPRWNGDTNYMTTIAESRVIPQFLEETYHTLMAYFAS